MLPAVTLVLCMLPAVFTDPLTPPRDSDFNIDNLLVEQDSERCPSTKNDTHTLLTIFTTISLQGSKRDIFINTVTIWAQLGPDVRMVLYADEVDCTEWTILFLRNLGWQVRVIPRVNDDLQLPIVRYMFIDAIQTYSSTFYMYANGDMLFDLSLPGTLGGLEHLVLEQPRMFIVGRRHNYRMQEGESFLTLMDVREASYVSEIDNSMAIDYFITTKNGYPWRTVPDFVVGRLCFDSWLMSNAITSGLVTIDLSTSVLALHQSDSGGSRESASLDIPDRTFNIDLVGNFLNQFSTTICAPYNTKRAGNGAYMVHFRQLTKRCVSRYEEAGFWPTLFSGDSVANLIPKLNNIVL